MLIDFLKKLPVILALGLSAAVLGACEEQGPAEQAGEAVDNAAEETGEALEEAGDAAQDSTNN